VVTLEKSGVFSVKEPNLIGQIGELIATYILKELYPFPTFEIVRSNTYPYYIVNELRTDRADFEIHSKNGRKKVILVEVKTTIKKTFHISGSENRRYLQKELKLYQKHKDVSEIVILKICLGQFPAIKYKIELLKKI